MKKTEINKYNTLITSIISYTLQQIPINAMEEEDLKRMKKNINHNQWRRNWPDRIL